MSSLLLGLILGLGLPQPALGAQTPDYLPTDLRSRVDQLKLDLQASPTNRTNAASRARVTWSWLNAYAVQGGYIPVDATRVIAAVLADANPANIAALDDVIREFQFLDEEPDGLGQLSSTTGPFQAAAYATIEQTFTVGSQPVQTGGAFLIARHFMANFGQWQTTDPKADHYISISSSNNKVTFATRNVPRAGMHGGFRSTRDTLAFEVASGTLTPGDKVTITYGDTSGGSAGIMTPSFASDRMPLPIYVAFTERGHYYSLPIQPLRIEGGSINGVHAFTPSVVKPNEPFKLTVRAQDQFYNRATGAIPNWTVKLNGEIWQTLEAEGALTTSSVTITEPGTYFVTVHSEDGQIQGDGNPILVTDEARPRIFWGDTHGHSGFAEGIGTARRFMQWARDDASLDYVTHSEHDVWLDDAEWTVLRDIVKEFSEDGAFAAYLGYEWSVSGPRGGHHNVLFRTPDNRHRVPAQFYPTLSRLYQGLRTLHEPEDVVVIPHAHQAGDYRYSDPELEPLVEIMSQHGNFEWFGRLYLQHGHQVGFIAASDNHLSQPGYSAPIGGSLSQRGGLGALLAEQHSADDLFDAMRNLQAYATTGDRIILDFNVNDTAMGQRAEFAETRQVSGRVIGTAPISSISVIKNDQEIWRQDYLQDTDSRNAREGTFLLSFESDSDPYHPGDNPRGWRAWQGILDVTNADLLSIQAYDASFPLQQVEPAPDNPNRVNFATKTRGDTSSYLLRLDNIQRTAKLQFDIVEDLETGGAPPIYRPPQRVPALSFEMALKDLQDGQLSQRQSVGAYNDRVMLRKIRDDGARDIQFEFTDTGSRQGDYYFVRVVQANDAMAWSSPVWVGGHPTR
ncbi:MAG: DUF3604 domain-containing protein [Pseudomonadota bacterium]